MMFVADKMALMFSRDEVRPCSTRTSPCLSRPSWALIATPGQDNIYIITRGIAQGRKAALVSAWGV